MRNLVRVLVAVALCGHVTAALAAGDPAAGKALADLWCSACHLVSDEQAIATTEAPPFAEIATRRADAFDALAAFLADPHPPMPDMSLTRQEIGDLLAYIGSLK